MNPKTRAMLKCDLYEKHLVKINSEIAILSWKLLICSFSLIKQTPTSASNQTYHKISKAGQHLLVQKLHVIV